MWCRSRAVEICMSLSDLKAAFPSASAKLALSRDFWMSRSSSHAARSTHSRERGKNDRPSISLLPRHAPAWQKYAPQECVSLTQRRCPVSVLGEEHAVSTAGGGGGGICGFASSPEGSPWS